MSLQTELYRLLLTADPDCGVLARVGGILSTLDLLPERLHARCHGRAPDRVIRIAGRVRATPRQADLLERKLGQLPPVIRVRCEATCTPELDDIGSTLLADPRQYDEST